jgi:Kef-type K+ transport system membrane component KefB
VTERFEVLSGLLSGPSDRLEALLLVGSILVWLGYLALRYSRKLQIPVVTAFLVLGVAFGPSGLNLVNSSLLDSLRIIEPVALGMITFAAGERLRITELADLSCRHYAAIVLETILPVAVVTIGVFYLTGRIEVALPIGAIAGTTGLATVISTLKESGAKGTFTKMLGVAVATDNVFSVVFFSLTLPLVVALAGQGSVGRLYLDGLLSLVASVAIGAIAGILVSRSVRNVRSSQELSMFALAYVLLVAAITEFLHFSVLLAGLSMGATAANLTTDERDRDRVFAALGPLEYPIFSIFFLWAGASLHVRALGGIGWMFGVYILGRAIGKLAGPFLASIGSRWACSTAVQFRSLGVALLPQAGAAVGLAVIARDSLPEQGEVILAAVLASVVVFEVVGPLGVHWAARAAGEVREWSAIEPLTLDEAVKELETRKARVVVLRHVSGPQPIMDAPQKMAARLKGHLVEVPVSEGSGGSAQSQPNPETSPDNNGAPVRCAPVVANVEQQVLVLDDQHVGAFYDSVTQLKPDVLFLALPRKLRYLLGSHGAMVERLGCPVFELPVVKERRWAETLSSTLSGADKAMGKVTSRWKTQWQPKLVSRLTDRNEES